MQAARRLHRRAARDRSGTFLLEGPLIVRDALRAGLSLTDVFVRADDPEMAELARECRGAGAAVLEVGESVLRSVADTATPQGVVAVAATPVHSLADLPGHADLVLVLDQVRDPGNAGTMIRSAAAAGADLVVFTTGSVDPFSPKTVRSSAGSAFKVPVDRGLDAAQAAGALRSAGFTLVAGSGTAETEIFDVDLTGKVAIVVGNEAWGFEGSTGDVVDVAAAIPMAADVESLNVAVAGSIFLFEVVRQRRLSSARHG